MYSTSDLKPGLILEFEGEPHAVETTHASSPSARGASTIHRVKMRNLKTKQRIERTFRGGDTFGVPNVDKKPIQFLYADTEHCHFMDQEDFEQFALDLPSMEWEMKFLVDGIEGLRVLLHDEAPVAIELPNSVTLEIEDTAPAVKGGASSGRTKPATLSTGHVIQVPEHVAPGTPVTVDTRTGEFTGRASK